MFKLQRQTVPVFYNANSILFGHNALYTTRMKDVVLLLHDIRSTHNVGSFIRTSECFGVNHIYFSGYTPYPIQDMDERLPHLREKIHKQISKTSLGTESKISCTHIPDITDLITTLRSNGYVICALEQDDSSTMLHAWESPQKLALLVGREVEGLSEGLLEMCDEIIEIKQLGTKESLNVVQATAVALYHIQFAHRSQF